MSGCSKLIVISLLLCVGAQAEVGKWTLNGLSLEVPGKDAQQQTKIETVVNPLLLQLNTVADELKQLNQHGEVKKPSAELLELLSLCEHWQIKTSNKFSCRLGGLQKDWQAAAVSGELPDRAALRQKARRHLRLQWTADHQKVRFSDQAKTEGLQLDLQGLWQGWVIEQLSRALNAKVLNELDVNGIQLNYGAVRTGMGKGNNSERIRLQGLESVAVFLPKGQTLAVVDRTENLRRVGHYSLNQTLVPDEGWPVEFAPSLIVRATSAIEAGVMSSALLVVPAYRALAAANLNTGVEVLTITETGKFFASREWYATDANKSAEPNPWHKNLKFKVEFEIPELDVAEYRRPYIAIWINDSTGQAVQSLLVAGDSARWLRELRQWWRKLGRSDDGLIDATAGATRNPGRYQLEWDGRSFNGKKVAAGNYELHVEVAREHGDHEILVLPFVLDGKPIKLKQQGKQELGSVTLNLR